MQDGECAKGHYAYMGDLLVVAKALSPERVALAGLDRGLIEGMLQQLADMYSLSDASAPFELPPNWIVNAIAKEKVKRQVEKDSRGRQPKQEGAKKDTFWKAVFKFVRNSVLPIPKSYYDNVEAMISDVEFRLEGKNVAVDAVRAISDQLRRLYTDPSCPVSKEDVRAAFAQYIRSFLKCETRRDLLAELSHKMTTKQVFIVAVMGTNGVGKSTTLAKLAYHIKGNSNARILVAACDTFRSGAVEQLRQHCHALHLDLFDRGYGNEPAQVAYDALETAKNNHYDVLLIDTAGRMQTNQPLMTALAKLVTTTAPDLNLFVGEALVGNDCVDQIAAFDHTLRQTPKKHTIDGIILTKFDTVDEKIGATLSVAFQSKKPILYVGTGQQYSDIRTLDVSLTARPNQYWSLLGIPRSRRSPVLKTAQDKSSSSRQKATAKDKSNRFFLSRTGGCLLSVLEAVSSQYWKLSPLSTGSCLLSVLGAVSWTQPPIYAASDDYLVAGG
ncbi:putative signal recognition particle protein SRP54 [Gregarina niphandrodes]|uniref:Signal recognition particle receptor subunit alpha homolog n=1 Tax=Gregarina niphandrodes TaxID=110365 RepID=A0A023AXS9_GRENI|nr:putative signal recognition particle protein SRP54 [Gregarina niphandrodes]EZG43456.1 putative signal recognition particle protein SRP54 [Gregarina niphandrodes]|eukprot:XP_011133307.1 putative signal recognition particle protein SRP54 [Gregarina niphandrodes]